jgi:dolichol kinase
MAVIMFIPPLIHDVDWLRFSFVMAACVFILVETFRLFCCGIDSRLAWGMETFRNGLDTGDAVLSHLWLLLGCAIPVFAVGNIWEISVAASGIVSLGILDSAAAVFGMGFGKTQWPGSEKTIVGSIAGMLAYVFAQYVVFSLQSFRDQSVPIVPWFIQGLICAAWEATSDQNDNITLPLVAYISCTIIPAIA